jgi:hypothetical protein
LKKTKRDSNDFTFKGKKTNGSMQKQENRSDGRMGFTLERQIEQINHGEN